MHAQTLTMTLALALAVGGCGGSDRPPGGGGDGGGGRYDGGGGSGNDGGGGGDACLAAAQDFVYLVDSDRRLVRFDPADLSFNPIGTLDCPSGGATPFSMAVDRDARAWVLHQNGAIYFVSTADASCTTTTFTPHQDGFELFGMGFVANSDMSEDETLYVAGGAEASIASGMASFGSIDTGTLALMRRGNLPGWPELTGTGSAELWGFFPDTRPPTVRQLDKSNGTTLQSFDLDRSPARRRRRGPSRSGADASSCFFRRRTIPRRTSGVSIRRTGRSPRCSPTRAIASSAPASRRARRSS